MANIKRLDRLDVSTADLKDAIATYRHNFNLDVTPSSDGGSAMVAIGGTQIALVPAPQGDAEGMSGVWLEADNVDAVGAALSKSGYGFKPIRVESSRRVLEVEAGSANQVSLYIFDLKV